MVGIYKIENLINHKVYIGQSIHIERRWSEHKQKSSKSVISQAIKKYGVENFSFEVLEECRTQDLGKRESYYIQKYDCMIPKGYNIDEPLEDGYHITYQNLDKNTVLEIINEIQNTDLIFSEIAEKYNVSIRTITRINQGYTYHQPDIQYPLREQTQLPDAFCIDCGKPIWKSATRCIECNNIYQRKVKRPNKEELYSFLIKNKGNFTLAGKNYGGVDGNSVRKWCKNYGLPWHSKDYKPIKTISSDANKPKKVIQLDKKTGEELGCFDSMKDAARWLYNNQYTTSKDISGIATHIGDVCHGKRETAYKFKWKFAEE